MPSPMNVASPVRAVIFDLFDTLVDEERERLPRLEVLGRDVHSTHGMLHAALLPHADVDFETFALALRDVDRGANERYWAAGRELPTLERFRLLAERLAVSDPAVPDLLTRVHMAGLREAASPVPRHADVLTALGRVFRIGLCSNFSHASTARAVLADAGLLAHFDALAISEEVGLRKPRREIFEAVLRDLGVRPAEAVHVGDKLAADVAGAAALGMRAVWVTRRVRDPEAALRAHGGLPPAWIVADLAELPGLLPGASGGP
jgi:HAD superfamily hydrolase (TIGR01493 family)